MAETKSAALHYSMRPMIGARPHILILGSMPGAQSLKMQQYYANPRNQFWRILGTLFGRKAAFESYEQKCDFLKKNQVALWDSIHQCRRQGSLDSAIREEEPNDIPGLLDMHPGIRLVAFNGSKSCGVFRKSFGFRRLKERGIAHLRLPSTSPTPSRYPKSLAEKIDDWSVIKDYL
ncbi:DNA-deoxyinosine glycosylase [Sporolactobacillus vineae]|uniref:DNA-deoxyinosine glycosylase n=1 Tax=Sporolactobacillus vineae TaxID=444463 RepID=UPI000289DD5D|nr:DNA-deoxyinosine glycosylase [Sporolactobacillus vineae]